MNPTPVPAMLVSNITLHNGSVVQAIPFSTGSILVEPVASVSKSVGMVSSGENSSTNESITPALRMSTKGRRPKNLATEMKPGIDLALGMFSDRPMCRSCGKYFMSRQQLNQHMLVHTDVRKYKCTYCERTFKQPSHLHQHHRIHTGEKPYRCPIPGCNRAFPQQSNLNHHLRNHDKPAPPPENTCSLCMRVYASETVLRSHISKIHMCDPDTLLGARKKIQSKDISRQQYPDSITDAVSGSGHNRTPDAVLGTFNNISCGNNGVVPKFLLENCMSHFGNASQEKNEGSLFSQNANVVQSNGSYGTSLINGNVSSQSEVLGKVKAENDSDGQVSEESYDQPVLEKPRLPYGHMISMPNNDLLHHFVVTATSRQATNNTNGSGMKNSNGTDKKSHVNDKDITISSNFSQCALNHEEHKVDTRTIDDTLPSHTNRSRKRKAFQPQRIVQKMYMTDEQEYAEF